MSSVAMSAMVKRDIKNCGEQAPRARAPGECAARDSEGSGPYAARLPDFQAAHTSRTAVAALACPDRFQWKRSYWL
jgi:hypothetical protein